MSQRSQHTQTIGSLTKNRKSSYPTSDSSSPSSSSCSTSVGSVVRALCGLEEVVNSGNKCGKCQNHSLLRSKKVHICKRVLRQHCCMVGHLNVRGEHDCEPGHARDCPFKVCTCLKCRLLDARSDILQVISGKETKLKGTKKDPHCGFCQNHGVKILRKGHVRSCDFGQERHFKKDNCFDCEVHYIRNEVNRLQIKMRRAMKEDRTLTEEQRKTAREAITRDEVEKVCDMARQARRKRNTNLTTVQQVEGESSLMNAVNLHHQQQHHQQQQAFYGGLPGHSSTTSSIVVKQEHVSVDSQHRGGNEKSEIPWRPWKELVAELCVARFAGCNQSQLACDQYQTNPQLQEQKHQRQQQLPEMQAYDCAQPQMVESAYSFFSAPADSSTTVARPSRAIDDYQQPVDLHCPVRITDCDSNNQSNNDILMEPVLDIVNSPPDSPRAIDESSAESISPMRLMSPVDHPNININLQLGPLHTTTTYNSNNNNYLNPPQSQPLALVPVGREQQFLHTIQLFRLMLQLSAQQQ